MSVRNASCIKLYSLNNICESADGKEDLSSQAPATGEEEGLLSSPSLTSNIGKNILASEG